MSNDLRKMSYFWRFLNNTSAFLTMHDVPIQSWRGTFLPSSSLRSYVITICASKAFSSVVAKDRPGLLQIHVWMRDMKANKMK